MASEPKSRCSICGSTAYGRGCILSPYKQTHIHLDDKTRCSWCGSKSLYGYGCSLSPTKKHGFGANLYVNVASESFFMATLLKLLSEKHENSAAYHLGIIDENGKMLKKPETEEEKAAFGPLESFILKLKGMIGPKLELMHTEVLLSKLNESMKNGQSVDNFAKELELKNRLAEVSKDFYEIVEDAKVKGVSMTSLDKIITETFGR